MSEHETWWEEAMELEPVDLGQGRFAVLDLGEWAPRVHILEGLLHPTREEIERALEALGCTFGRQRGLLVREMRALRASTAKGGCWRGTPRSVAVEADAGAGERLAAVITAAAKAGSLCERVELVVKEVLDVDAVAAAVRALYAIRVYRVRLIVKEESVRDDGTRTRLLEALRELWSVQPELRIRWEPRCALGHAEPNWGEVAARAWLSGFESGPVEAVWEWFSRAQYEVVGFDLGRDADGREARVRWLVKAYEKDLVPSPDSCMPYSDVLRALRQPRLPSAPCVRWAERLMHVDAEGRSSCCPGMPFLEDSEQALAGSRYWDCAMKWIERRSAACCNPGRLMRWECEGDSSAPCPGVECQFARRMLPAALRKLQDSMIESPQKVELPAVRQVAGPARM